MARGIVWTDAALDDIDSIAEYIQRDSPHHARRVVDAIFAVADAVVHQPRLGRIVPELDDPDTRERFVYSYRIIYELHGDTAYVLAVIHGRRLLEALSDRFT